MLHASLHAMLHLLKTHHMLAFFESLFSCLDSVITRIHNGSVLLNSMESVGLACHSTNFLARGQQFCFVATFKVLKFDFE